ncbi:MAG: DNA polymerase III subunit delta [Clostridia bacterium]|nr:DNA polymerase III subunit delta [Clostridia bacterium]
MADTFTGELKSIAEMKQHIAAGIPAKAYMLFGEETYLKALYAGRLKKLLTDDGMNIVAFDGEFDPDRVAEEIGTLSLFGEKKLVYIRNSGLFKKSAPLSFLDGIEDSDTSVLFVEDEVDRRLSAFKEFLKRGVVFECKKAEEQDIVRLLASEAKAAGRVLTPDAARLMLEGIGTDISTLNCELEKLILFVPEGGRIEAKHVRNVCCLSETAGIFELTGAMSVKDTGRALRLLRALLEDKEDKRKASPLGILTMISRNWENLYRTRLMLDEKLSESEIQRRTNQKPYAVKKQCEQCRRFTAEELRRKLEFVQELDQAVKTGNITDTVALELAVTN